MGRSFFRTSRYIFVVVCLIFLFALPGTRSVKADAIACSETALDAAIQAANAASTGSIELPDGCEILLSGNFNAGSSYNGPGPTGLTPITGSVTIFSKGDGATIRRGSLRLFRLFSVRPGGTLSLLNLTLADGISQGGNGGYAGDRGGGGGGSMGGDAGASQVNTGGGGAGSIDRANGSNGGSFYGGGGGGRGANGTFTGGKGGDGGSGVTGSSGAAYIGGGNSGTGGGIFGPTIGGLGVGGGGGGGGGGSGALSNGTAGDGGPGGFGGGGGGGGGSRDASSGHGGGGGFGGGDGGDGGTNGGGGGGGGGFGGAVLVDLTGTLNTFNVRFNNNAASGGNGGLGEQGGSGGGAYGGAVFNAGIFCEVRNTYVGNRAIPGSSGGGNGSDGIGAGANSYNYTLAGQGLNVCVSFPPTITISPSTLPRGTFGVPYSQQLTASGGYAPYQFTVSAGVLPPGLTLNSSGLLSGTPTTTPTHDFTFNITATDATGNTALRDYTLSVQDPTLVIDPAMLPNGNVGTRYSQSLTANGGTAPYTLSIVSGSLPNGITLTSSGIDWILTGFPTAIGTYNFTIQATDTNGNTGSRTYTVIINPSLGLVINPSTLPDGQVGRVYNLIGPISGGSIPYIVSVSAGNLPFGLGVRDNGPGWQLFGTPVFSGTYSFTISVTDSFGNTGTREYTLIIKPMVVISISPATLPNAAVGTIYNQTITASGGTAPYAFSVSAGMLPSVLMLNPNTGAIFGVLDAAGTYTFTIKATDADGNFGTRDYTIIVVPPTTITLSPATLPNATVGTVYSQTITASGGTAPYTFSVSAGALPDGLTLNANTGVLSGTPTAVGVFSFTIKASDNLGISGTRAYTVFSNPGVTVTLTPATLPNGTVGTPYSQTITASGGTAPYTFSITAGALPNGLTLNAATGVLSGTTNVNGTFTITVKATDANGNFGTQAYTFAITQALSFDPTSLPAGRMGVFYTQLIVASGGTAPYTFSLTSGIFPAGLNLSNGGMLSGTPLSGGAFTFTVRATDSASRTATQRYTLQIEAGRRPDTIGVYSNGTFYLRNSNTIGAADITVTFGAPENLPVVGDWNGDGVDTIGVYISELGVFLLRDSNAPGNADYAFVMGNPGDEPIAGKWDASMTHDGIGVYRPSNGLLYAKDALASGFADYTMVLGNPGDHGIAGDWDGDGYDSIGVFRPSGTRFYLANRMGGTMTTPAIIFSDYDFAFGPAIAVPIAGDWLGVGHSEVGYTLNGAIYLKNSFTSGGADLLFAFGAPGAHPIMGKWTLGGSPNIGSIIVSGATRTPVPDPTGGDGHFD